MTASGFVSVWHWFSQDHAIAAATLSRKCVDLEVQLADVSNDQDLDLGSQGYEDARLDHRSFAIGSIVSSVAFLDACMSEIFTAAEYPNIEIAKALSDQERRVLADSGELVANNRLLDRCQLVLHLLGRSPFDRGAQPFQDAKLTVQLRNELVHYKPQWRTANDPNDAASDSGKLMRALQSKRFSRNPYTGLGNPFFPNGCLGHGCTEWAFNSILALADELFRRVGIDPVYGNERARLTP